jgi:hypothetical protein
MDYVDPNIASSSLMHFISSSPWSIVATNYYIFYGLEIPPQVWIILLLMQQMDNMFGLDTIIN